MITTRQPAQRAPRGTARASDPTRAARIQRDAAFERTGSITKTIGVASVAAVAVFGIYLSRALPGHTSTPAASTSGSTSGGSTSGGSTSGGQSSGGYSSGNVAPPYSAPVQTQQPAPVVSGSS
ncbi:MAG TPA: hypothetical protein VII19_09005 [Acidimicrobiales bacterium]